MQVKPIKWLVSPPVNFPCFKCRSNEAEYNVKINLNPGSLHLCLCPACVETPELELISEFTTRRR